MPWGSSRKGCRILRATPRRGHAQVIRRCTDEHPATCGFCRFIRRRATPRYHDAHPLLSAFIESVRPGAPAAAFYAWLNLAAVELAR